MYIDENEIQLGAKTIFSMKICFTYLAELHFKSRFSWVLEWNIFLGGGEPLDVSRIFGN